MATLPQRFKLLATRCAAGAPSPSRSPAPSYAASPGYRLRRRRGAGRSRGGYLRRFLCRRVGGGGPEPARTQEEDKRPLVGRSGRTLRDLFVASPESARRRGGCGCDDEEEDDEGAIGAGMAAPSGHGGGGGGGRRFGAGGLRSLLAKAEAEAEAPRRRRRGRGGSAEVEAEAPRRTGGGGWALAERVVLGLYGLPAGPATAWMESLNYGWKVLIM